METTTKNKLPHDANQPHKQQTSRVVHRVYSRPLNLLVYDQFPRFVGTPTNPVSTSYWRKYLTYLLLHKIINQNTSICAFQQLLE